MTFQIDNFIHKRETVQKSSIVQEWREYASHKAKISKVYLAYQPEIEQKRKIQGFQRFLSCAKLQKELKLNNQKASEYYYHKTWLKVRTGWIDRVIKNKAETMRVVRIRNMLQKKRVAK
jgi:hypothetical protein